MPIYSLLQDAAFESEHVEALGLAFEETLLALGLKDRNDPLVEMVAKKIIKLGQQGERDPERLRETALKEFKT